MTEYSPTNPVYVNAEGQAEDGETRNPTSYVNPGYETTNSGEGAASGNNGTLCNYYIRPSKNMEGGDATRNENESVAGAVEPDTCEESKEEVADTTATDSAVESSDWEGDLFNPNDRTASLPKEKHE